MNLISKSAFPSKLTAAQVTELVAQALPAADYRGKKILLIVPDHTRTAPVGLLFKTIYAQIGETTKNIDVLVAFSPVHGWRGRSSGGKPRFHHHAIHHAAAHAVAI